jgi:hypothetical protein
MSNTQRPYGRESMAGPEVSGPSRVSRAVPLPEQLPPPIEALLTRCSVALRFLAAARAGRTLTPPQRHVLLHTFAHLGNEGHTFIHQVLAQGEGYDPDVVNREILAVPPQPIGCRAIRRRLGLHPDRDGCNCVFRLTGDTYASPLCHLGIFPEAPSPILRRQPRPPDLDGEGRAVGYVARKAKAAATLDDLDRAEPGQGVASDGWLPLLRRLLGGG